MMARLPYHFTEMSSLQESMLGPKAAGSGMSSPALAEGSVHCRAVPPRLTRGSSSSLDSHRYTLEQAQLRVN